MNNLLKKLISLAVLPLILIAANTNLRAVEIHNTSSVYTVVPKGMSKNPVVKFDSTKLKIIQSTSTSATLVNQKGITKAKFNCSCPSKNNSLKKSCSLEVSKGEASCAGSRCCELQTKPMTGDEDDVQEKVGRELGAVETNNSCSLGA